MTLSSQVCPLIRDFTREDSATIRTMAHENFDALAPLIYYSPQQIIHMKDLWSMTTMDIIAEEQEEGRRIILVAEVDHRVVGMASLVGNDVRMVLVKEDQQEEGIGRGLVERIEQIAKDKVLTEINVVSFVHTEGFYRKLGFVTQSREEIEAIGPRIHLKKELSAS